MERAIELLHVWRRVGESCAALFQSVLQHLPATTTSYGDANWIRARVRDGRVHESTWISMAMPPSATNATKHSDSVVREKAPPPATAQARVVRGVYCVKLKYKDALGPDTQIRQ